MADSDEDYDRDSSSKRRGKFRKEREDSRGSESNNRSARDTSHRSNGGYHSNMRSPSPRRELSPRNRFNNRHSSNRSPPPSRFHHPESNGRDNYRRADGIFKRPFSPSDQQANYHRQPNNNSMPTFNGHPLHHHHHQPPSNYNANVRARSPYGRNENVSSMYSQEPPEKKLRREWPPVNGMETNYFEHDNRFAPDNGNEHQMKANDFFPDRPSNRGTYNSSYRFDPWTTGQSEHRNSNFPGYSNHQQPDNYFNHKSHPAQNNSYMFNDNHNNQSAGQQHHMMNYHHSNNSQHQMQGLVNNQFTYNNGHQMANKFNNYNLINNSSYNNFDIGQTQPQMMSFKQFQSSSSIQSSDTKTILTPEMATKRYNEYKNEFRKDQIAKFYTEHKSEEWFKQRYHPDVSAMRKDEQRGAIKRRLAIFKDLIEKFNSNNELSLDMSEAGAEKRLSKFLDACMIRLEEGTDEDLAILETIYSSSSENLEDKVVEAKKDLKNLDVESGVESNSESESEDGNKGSDRDKKESNGDVKKDLEDEIKMDTVVESELKQQAETCVKLEEPIKKSKLLIPQKTQSIFFKHLPVNVTRQDLEEIGIKHEGFKRASISEPAPERRFQRRGWITFSSQVNIKEVCSKINGVKLYDMMLNASINRELEQKVKCIIGLTNHKQIVRNDLRLLAKIVDNMDRRWGLWQHEVTYSNNKLNDADFKTDSEIRKSKKPEPSEPIEEIVEKVDMDEQLIGVNNPFTELANEYLKELNEQSKKEEPEADNGDELIGEKKVSEDKPKLKNIKLERDERAASILDTLIIYLRLVHSIDFYNATEYQQEDWMPNRCGVLHVRGSVDHKSSFNSNVLVNILNGVNINYFDPMSIKKVQIEEWTRLFEINVKSFYDFKERIDGEIASRLGVKELRAEIDKYILANTKKVDKDVWLCPISNKKFKSAEYVKKHIETKHRDTLVEVRKNTECFNRFVYDPKRPYLPEHPFTKMMGNHHNGNGNQNGYNNHNGGDYGHNRIQGHNHNQSNQMGLGFNGVNGYGSNGYGGQSSMGVSQRRY